MFKRLYEKTPLIARLIVMLVCFLGFVVSMVNWKESKSPIVSIVMPVYNRSLLLSRAIDSVLKQTYHDFELVIVDDGSTDETQYLLNFYLKTYPDKIIVHRNESNLGVSNSRNIGNKLARGKYIVVLDSDDYFLPDFLENAVGYMETHPSIDLGIPLKAGYFEDKENPMDVHPINVGYDIYMFLNGNPLGNVGNIFKRSFIEKHGIFYNPAFDCGEDYDFWVQMILKNAKIGSIETNNRPVIFRLGGGLSLSYGCYTTSDIIIDNLYQIIDYKPKNGRFFLCDAVEKFLKKLVHYDRTTLENTLFLIKLPTLTKQPKNPSPRNLPKRDETSFTQGFILKYSQQHYS